jgi:hypothetical protein
MFLSLTFSVHIFLRKDRSYVIDGLTSFRIGKAMNVQPERWFRKKCKHSNISLMLIAMKVSGDQAQRLSCASCRDAGGRYSWKKDHAYHNPPLNDGFNPLNAELYPIFHLLSLLGAHPFLHVSTIRVKMVMFSAVLLCLYSGSRNAFNYYSSRYVTHALCWHVLRPWPKLRVKSACHIKYISM